MESATILTPPCTGLSGILLSVFLSGVAYKISKFVLELHKLWGGGGVEGGGGACSSAYEWLEH